jgi:hypothetical protein
MEGRCIDCGAMAEYGKVRCEKCLVEQRVRKRERYGEKKRIQAHANRRNLVEFDR